MSNKKLERLVWLGRRLSRASPAEIPYRVRCMLRIAAQSRGYLDARRCPPFAPDRSFGQPWVLVPELNEDERALLVEAAERILAHGVRIFDLDVPVTGAGLNWNCDPKTGHPIAMKFGLSIDYRRIEGEVDIKYLWEINRHLWWVTLAQAYAATSDRRFLSVLGVLLDSWLQACPYPLGPNWSSPVEHGIRLINWSATWHLIGGAASPLFAGEAGQELLRRWLASVYQHVRFASDNYSLHSSANNHLLGEAAGVFVAAHTWCCWPETRRLRVTAKAILEREALKQFAEDGVNREQAIGYHRFAMQFLLAAGLTGRASGDEFCSAFWARIESAMVFLAAMMDCAGRMPAIGDSDDGEVWRLGYGPGFQADQALLGLGAVLLKRGDLRAKVLSVSAVAERQWAWLFRGEAPAADEVGMLKLPSRFEAGGHVLLGEALHTPAEFRVSVNCGALGYNGIAGHGHADALSVLLSWAGEALLVDAGTYCYNAVPQWRRFFRGTSAHNTLVVDGLDQSVYGASFLWLRDVNTHLFPQTEPNIVHACHDGYLRLADPVRHHRRVSFYATDGSLLVEDWLECREGHEVELLWHAAADCQLTFDADTQAWLLAGPTKTLSLQIGGCATNVQVVRGAESPLQGWVSSAFYQKADAPALVIKARLAPSEILQTRIGRKADACQVASAAGACGL